MRSISILGEKETTEDGSSLAYALFLRTSSSCVRRFGPSNEHRYPALRFSSSSVCTKPKGLRTCVPLLKLDGHEQTNYGCDGYAGCKNFASVGKHCAQRVGHME
ncbi:hypothetical protein BC938DRAFT_482629 [Jimgerdemannia flammicorona]|uniref:Uncharacterized protein n=1 Tax=Jimgerdemannia flammicorona TaxID=994334 RepID=A0A433QDK0_9FUNG|nr:hypothetical protein BC938DRAFT_482629 [Jimgerdemannia flammicorona]